LDEYTAGRVAGEEEPMARLLLALLGGLLVAIPAAAQNRSETYPSRVVRLVVPYPPGGGINNTVARILIDQQTPICGYNVVVDDRPGANCITGTSIVTKAERDGYTLGLVLATHVINPARALQQSVVRERLSDIGVEPRGTNPARFSAFLTSEREKFARIIRAANISLN